MPCNGRGRAGLGFYLPVVIGANTTKNFFHFKLFKHKIPSAIQSNRRKKNLITIIHYNIYIFTVYLSKTYLDAAALPESRVFIFFQLLK